MPPEIQHAQSILDLVAPENLEWNDKRVLHQVRVDGSVKDLDRAVIRGGCEERVGSVVGDGTQGLCVVSESRTRFS